MLFFDLSKDLHMNLSCHTLFEPKSKIIHSDFFDGLLQGDHLLVKINPCFQLQSLDDVKNRNAPVQMAFVIDIDLNFYCLTFKARGHIRGFFSFSLGANNSLFLKLYLTT